MWAQSSSSGGWREKVLQHRHQQLKRLLHLSPSSLTCLHTLFTVINFRLVAHPYLKDGRAGEKSYSISGLKLSSISIFISYFLSRLFSLRSFVHFISFQCSLRTFPSFTLLMNPFVRHSFTCCALSPSSLSLSPLSFFCTLFLLRSWCGCIASFRFVWFLSFIFLRSLVIYAQGILRSTNFSIAL